MNPKLTFSGKVKVEVLGGKEGEWQSNLILDSGMDNLAIMSIAKFFENCCAGVGTSTGTNDTKKVGTGVTFTYDPASGTVTATGAFFAGDLTDQNKLLHFNPTSGPAWEAYIIAFGNTTQCNIGQSLPQAGASLSGMAGTMYFVDQTNLDNEVVRTNQCMGGSSSNFSSNGSGSTKNQCVFQRVFIFPEESAANTSILDSESFLGTYTVLATGTQHVTMCATGGRLFVAGDVGKMIYFTTSKTHSIITAVDGTGVATVIWTGTLPASTGEPIILYDFNTYTEIGFSDVGNVDETAAPTSKPVNVRIKLASSIPVYPSIGGQPAQQLKVTYTLTVSVGPPGAYNIGYGSLPIYGTTATPFQSFSWSGVPTVQGKMCIEGLAFSDILGDGTTDDTSVLPTLDPYCEAYVGVSSTPSPTPVCFAPASRPTSIFKHLTREQYSTGTGTNNFVNYFDGSYTPADSVVACCNFFMGNQNGTVSSFVLQLTTPTTLTKAADQSFRIVFSKTWSRSLT